mmetsp:Transcript_1095/g.3485  ORF Transcript_1095/g.3485 Transcript_1095/m.3485 type:complete len:261 (-) Transcript_1095:929-1711(-)
MGRPSPLGHSSLGRSSLFRRRWRAATGMGVSGRKSGRTSLRPRRRTAGPRRHPRRASSRQAQPTDRRCRHSRSRSFRRSHRSRRPQRTLPPPLRGRHRRLGPPPPPPARPARSRSSTCGAPSERTQTARPSLARAWLRGTEGAAAERVEGWKAEREAAEAAQTAAQTAAVQTAAAPAAAAALRWGRHKQGWRRRTAQRGGRAAAVLEEAVLEEAATARVAAPVRETAARMKSKETARSPTAAECVACMARRVAGVGQAVG